MKTKKILMCGSNLSVKGGMVSVVKNYLSYSKWDDFFIKYIPTHTDGGKIKVALYYLNAFIHVIYTAVIHKYDVVYLHTAERGSFYRKSFFVWFFHLFGIKTILHHHAAEFEQFYDKSPSFCRKYINKTLELADLNIVLSNRLIGMITDKSPKARVRVLYNAVQTYPVNQYNEDSTGVLFLGRLGKRKGTYDLLRTIKALDNQLNDEIKFYLCGDGEISEVKEWIKKEKIEHRIAYVGWIDQKEKEKIFRNTMINVLPSYNEGLPMTILETMAYGIPNISTNIASIPEVLFDGQNGFLLEPGDLDMLQQRIFLLSNDSSLRKQFSEKSLELMTEKFALDNHIEQLKSYIEEIMN